MFDLDCLMSHLDDLFEGYPDTLTVAELAAILRIQVPTAYKWLREGTIPAYKVGSTWVILRDEVKQLIASGHNVAAPQDEPPADSA